MLSVCFRMSRPPQNHNTQCGRDFGMRAVPSWTENHSAPALCQVLHRKCFISIHSWWKTALPMILEENFHQSEQIMPKKHFSTHQQSESSICIAEKTANQMYLYLDKGMVPNGGMEHHQHRKTQYSGNQAGQATKCFREECCNYREFNIQPSSKMDGELWTHTDTHLHVQTSCTVDADSQNRLCLQELRVVLSDPLSRPTLCLNWRAMTARSTSRCKAIFICCRAVTS